MSDNVAAHEERMRLLERARHLETRLAQLAAPLTRWLHADLGRFLQARGVSPAEPKLWAPLARPELWWGEAREPAPARIEELRVVREVITSITAAASDTVTGPALPPYRPSAERHEGLELANCWQQFRAQHEVYRVLRARVRALTP